jgi:hypothetical protein
MSQAWMSLVRRPWNAPESCQLPLQKLLHARPLNEGSSALLMNRARQHAETVKVMTASRLDLGPDGSGRGALVRAQQQPYRRNRRAVNRAAQLKHHSSALDSGSSATRAIVWLAFSVGLIWVGVGVTALVAPGTVQPPTWSASVPGQLKLDGKPAVTSSINNDRSASIVVADKGTSTTYRVAITDPASVRTFWRGSDLIVDTAGAVWRVDTKHDLVLRAPASYGWPQD